MSAFMSSGPVRLLLNATSSPGAGVVSVSASDSTNSASVFGFGLSTIFFGVNLLVTAAANWYTKKTEREERQKQAKAASERQLDNQKAIKTLQEDLLRTRRQLDKKDKETSTMLQYYRPLVLSMYDLQSRIKQLIGEDFVRNFFAGHPRQALYMVVNTIYVFSELLAWMSIMREEVQVLTPVLGQEFTTQELLDTINSLGFMLSGETATQGCDPKKRSSHFLLLKGQQRLVGEAVMEESKQRKDDAFDTTFYVPMTYFNFRTKLTKDTQGLGPGDATAGPNPPRAEPDADKYKKAEVATENLKPIADFLRTNNTALCQGVEPVINSVLDFYELVIPVMEDKVDADLANRTRTRLVAIHAVLILFIMIMDPETDKDYDKVGREGESYPGATSSMWSHEESHGLSGHGPLLKHEAILLNFFCLEGGWHKELVDFLIGPKGLSEKGPLPPGDPKGNFVIPNVAFNPGLGFLTKYLDYFPLRDEKGRLIGVAEDRVGGAAADEEKQLCKELAESLEKFGKDRGKAAKSLQDARADIVESCKSEQPKYIPHAELEPLDYDGATYFYDLSSIKEAERKVLMDMYFRSPVNVQNYLREDLRNARIRRMRIRERTQGKELLKLVANLAVSGWNKFVFMDTNQQLTLAVTKVGRTVIKRAFSLKQRVLGNDHPTGVEIKNDEQISQQDWLKKCSEELRKNPKNTNSLPHPLSRMSSVSFATGRLLRMWFYENAQLRFRDRNTRKEQRQYDGMLLEFQTKGLDTRAKRGVGSQWMRSTKHPTKKGELHYPNDSRLYKFTEGIWEEMSPEEIMEVYKEVRRRRDTESDISSTQRVCARGLFNVTEENKERKEEKEERDKERKEKVVLRRTKSGRRLTASPPPPTNKPPAHSEEEIALPPLIASPPNRSATVHPAPEVRSAADLGE